MHFVVILKQARILYCFYLKKFEFLKLFAEKWLIYFKKLARKTFYTRARTDEIKEY